MKKLLFLAIAVSAIGSLLAGDNYVPSYQGYFNGAESFDANGSRVMTPRVIVSGTTTTAPSTTERTPTFSTLTTTGTLAAGARELTMIFSADFTGLLVNTGTISLSGSNTAAVTLRAPPGDTIGAIPLTITTGTVSLIKIP